jgi:hypothetical protein
MQARSVASEDSDTSDDECFSDSGSEADVPPVILDVKRFFLEGEPLQLFREHFAALW